MHKGTRLASIICLCLLVGYSAAWVFGAYRLKQGLEERFQSFRQSQKGVSIAFSFDDVSVGGFPFRWDVALQNPTFIRSKTYAQTGIELSVPKAIISAALGSHNYDIALIGDLSVTLRKAGETKRYHSRFKTSPNIHFAFTPGGELLIPVPYMSLPRNEQAFFEQLSQFSIDLGATEHVDTKHGKWVSRFDNASIKVDIDAIDEENLFLNVATNVKQVELNPYILDDTTQSERVSKSIASHYHNAGKTDFAIALTFSGPRSLQNQRVTYFDLAINELSLATELHALQFKANVSKRQDTPLPYGTATVSLNNYRDWVDFILDLAMLQREMISDPTAVALLDSITPKQREALKRFLRSISTETDTSSTDVFITMEREQGRPFAIGGRSLIEVTDIWAGLQ